MHPIWFAVWLWHWLFEPDGKSPARALVPGLEANTGLLTVIGILVAVLAVLQALTTARDDCRLAQDAEADRAVRQRSDALLEVQHAASVMIGVADAANRALGLGLSGPQDQPNPAAVPARTAAAIAANGAAEALRAMQHSLPMNVDLALATQSAIRLMVRVEDALTQPDDGAPYVSRLRELYAQIAANSEDLSQKLGEESARVQQTEKFFHDLRRFKRVRRWKLWRRLKQHLRDKWQQLHVRKREALANSRAEQEER